MTGFVPSIQVKVDLHSDLRRDWLSFENGGAEAPILDGFDGFFVETHSQALAYTNVVGATVLANNQHKQNNSLEFRLPRLIGKTGLGAVDYFGYANTALT